MFCNNCGAQIPEGNGFCPACGSAVTPQAPVEPTMPQAPVEPTMPQAPVEPTMPQMPGAPVEGTMPQAQMAQPGMNTYDPNMQPMGNAGTIPQNYVDQSMYNGQMQQQAQANKPDDGGTMALIAWLLQFGYIPVAGIAAYLSDELASLISGILSLCPLAGFILMIVTRVKYPQNKAAKVLMIVDIVLFVLGVIGTILFIVAFASCLAGVSASGY